MIQALAQSTSTTSTNGIHLLSILDVMVPALIALGVAYATIKAKLSTLEKGSETIERKVEILEKDVKEILKELNQMKGREEVSRQSPLSLTEVGVKTFSESGAERYIEKHRDTLLKKFKDIETPFDIQEKSKDIVRVILKNESDISPELKRIKEYLFKEGKDVEKFITVMSIGLRDVVLQHKNIPVHEEQTVHDKAVV